MAERRMSLKRSGGMPVSWQKAAKDSMIAVVRTPPKSMMRPFLLNEIYPFLTLINIRKATKIDASAIAAVHIRSWQAAYRGHFPDEFLNSLDSQFERRKETWTLVLDQPPSERSAVWVAETDGKLCGFAHITPSRGGEGADVGEVSSIYLEPEQWDKGIGMQLLKTATDDLRRMGFERAILWVLDANEHAKRFYEAAGWAPDGGSKIQNVWGIVCNEISYVADL
jgi:L-amino acid N-acyltransferase YncA